MAMLVCVAGLLAYLLDDGIHGVVLSLIVNPYAGMFHAENVLAAPDLCLFVMAACGAVGGIACEGLREGAVLGRGVERRERWCKVLWGAAVEDAGNDMQLMLLGMAHELDRVVDAMRFRCADGDDAGARGAEHGLYGLGALFETVEHADATTE